MRQLQQLRPQRRGGEGGSGRWSQCDLGHSRAGTAPKVGLTVSMETKEARDNTAEPPRLQSRPRAGREQSCRVA